MYKSFTEGIRGTDSSLGVNSAPDWLRKMYPGKVDAGFAPHHIEFWEWIWALELGVRSHPFIGVFPRGGGKSMSAELATVLVGCEEKRSYTVYVSATQDQANSHVQTVGTLLEAETIEEYYPAMGQRRIGKFGQSKGWRMDRLRTASGYTVDAIGLDTASRGLKDVDIRPDFVVLDDIDDTHDSRAVAKKKLKTLGSDILQLGSDSMTTLGIQNLIHQYSVFSMLAGEAPPDTDEVEILQDRQVCGPIPALRDMAYKRTEEGVTITHGEPTWEGQDMEDCQQRVDDVGISWFKSECQHDIEPPAGGIFDEVEYVHIEEGELPDIVKGVVAVDPAVTNTEGSDCQAIQADQLGADEKLYRRFSMERRMSPLDALKKAIWTAIKLGIQTVLVETDQGGDLWEDDYKTARSDVEEEIREWMEMNDLDRNGQLRWFGNPVRLPSFAEEKAGRSQMSKVERSQRMLRDYDRGNIIHVVGNGHDQLEAALNRFPETKPLDLADAAYWGWDHLCGDSYEPAVMSHHF